jgi:predicted transcriptional regulator of viral defense system
MDPKLLDKIREINKDYYSISDLTKILGLKRDSLYVTLNRWVTSGWIVRIGQGKYQLNNQIINEKVIANQEYSPSYLSFESALAEYGVLNQIAYALTFATTNMPKKMQIMGKNIEFKKLSNKYFFGYQLVDGLYIADKEKALVDSLYLMSLGGDKLDFDELNLNKLSKIRFIKYLKPFPNKTKRLAKKLMSKFKESNITVK